MPLHAFTRSFRRPGLAVAARLTALVFSVVGALAVPAGATTIPYRSDAELVALADRVVHGRVLDVRTEGAPDSGRIYTVTRLEVLEDLTGVNERVLEIHELGGRIGDREMRVTGAARFAVGDVVLVCLERTLRGLRPVAMSFSAFNLVSRTEGVALERLSGGADIVGAAPDANRTRTLDEFRRTVALVKGAASVAPAGDAALRDAMISLPSTRVSEPFTLLGGGIRWRQADTDTTVSWYRNTDRPSPLTSGDIDSEIDIALAAWTNPATVRIALDHGGTRSASGATDVFCTAVNSGAGLISFEDPENDIASGVLAVGGGCSGGPVHVVNDTTFSSFTHGFVVFNDAASLGASYKVAPSFTRVLTHEVGHGVGLGHTTTTTDLMYPSCCFSSMPLPPAIGPDDLAGVQFIYPMPSTPQCMFTLGTSGASYSSGGGSGSVSVTASAPSCARTASSNAAWLTITAGASGTGTGSVSYSVAANTGLPRTDTLTIAGLTFTVSQDQPADTDADGLPGWWESQFGLSNTSGAGDQGASGDPDGDGRTNLEEYNAGTHPRGFATRYLAEGAINDFFRTEIALLNPGTNTALTLVRVQPQGQAERNTFFELAGSTRKTLTSADLSTLTNVPFSTVVESDQPLVVDRTMSWDANGYGSHAETSIAAPATTWYLAEGSTSFDFSLFYLLQNPNATAGQATVRYLRPAPLSPVEMIYNLPPSSRTSIFVNAVAELASTDVSAVITATVPIIVERSMYLSQPGLPFVAGHESAGVTAPAPTWFLAEGATGTFFDLFLLIANPNASTSSVDVDYLLSDGTTLTKPYSIPGNSRHSIWVDQEEFPAAPGHKALADTSLGMRVRTTNSQPIIVERAMWWGQPGWYEAHNAAGTTVTGTRWALAGGEVGGSSDLQTWVLIANTSSTPGQAQVTLYFEDSTSATTTVDIQANSRTNVSISGLFPIATNRRFGIVVQSAGSPLPQIVVERAMYSNAGGLLWSAGTAAVATRLSP